MPIQYKSKSYNFALFTEKGLPRYIRFEIPNLSKDEIPEDLLPVIQAAKEHFLSVMRLTYRPDAVFFSPPIWSFVDENKPYSVGVGITERISAAPFNIEVAKNIFTGSFDQREELRLLVDGSDSRLPLQYRYLSLYKILELKFKKKDKWIKNELNAALETYKDVFKKKKIPLSSHIHALRDRCAHIKTGKKEMFGVTHLNHKAAVEVEAILPILGDLCVSIINDRANGKFSVHKMLDPEVGIINKGSVSS